MQLEFFEKRQACLLDEVKSYLGSGATRVTLQGEQGPW